MRVAVLGASPNPMRFSNKAIRLLLTHGHEVIPVNPGHEVIEGLTVVPSLSDIEGGVDTLTVYVGAHHISPLISDIVGLKPRRVILNPGTQAEPLIQALEKAQIPFQKDCTLVMLNCGRF